MIFFSLITIITSQKVNCQQIYQQQQQPTTLTTTLAPVNSSNKQATTIDSTVQQTIQARVSPTSNNIINNYGK